MFRQTSHAAVLVLLFATAANAVTISGFVRNSDGEGLPNTIIRVFAEVDGEITEIATTTSLQSPEGYYEVTVVPEGVITAVGYDNAAWQPRVVKNISGVDGDDHVIHKVLLSKQGPMKFLPILEQIHEYAELFHLQLAVDSDSESMSDIQSKMRSRFVDRIVAMPDPRRGQDQPQKQRGIIAEMKPEQQKILARELEELFQLYGLPPVATCETANGIRHISPRAGSRYEHLSRSRATREHTTLLKGTGPYRSDVCRRLRFIRTAMLFGLLANGPLMGNPDTLTGVTPRSSLTSLRANGAIAVADRSPAGGLVA